MTKSDTLKQAVQSALARLLQPLARWMLDAGIGVGEFVNLVKVAYVRAAVEQGRSVAGSARPNISRIAVVTGLTRVEVASLLQRGEAEPRSSDRGRQRAERVLSAWWTDPEFLTAQGEPQVLRLRGPGRTFATLCQRYSGEKRSAPVLQELLRVGAVRELAEGRLQALSRSFTTMRWDPAGVEAVGEQLQEYCETLVENLRHPTRARFARRVVNTRLDPRHAPMLIREIEHSLAVRTDALHETLNDPTHTAADGAPAMRLGVGVYVFEEASSGEGVSNENELTAPRDKAKPARKRRT
jgi:hypothetical protein